MESQSVNTQEFANRQFKIKEIPVLSFFTGGGFLDLGFEQAGFKIVWNNECNPVFADMYEYGTTTWRNSSSPNSKQAKISDRRSIVDIAACDIIEAAFPLEIPELFGMIGGPPCPDFSIGGKNRGHNGIHGPLSNVYVDRICEIKPDFFVFENVAGLFRTKKHREFLA
ncbi:MAG: DNA cytosine methyltransferase, partial [Methanosarcinaceae archaeon]|nr:DNA cytosine methyltransferase [Methanosarcinaceae archaeon]